MSTALRSSSAISLSELASRRAQLSALTGQAVLLVSNEPRARNLPMNTLPWRQDSSFLYFTGCDIPGSAALIEDGSLTLFLPAHDPADALWHGTASTPAEQGAVVGADRVEDLSALEARVRKMAPLVLAVADESVNRRVSSWTAKSLAFGEAYGDDALVDAVIALRRCKSAAEIAAMREAAIHTKVAHEAVMAATRPGSHERALTALFEGVLAVRGCTTGYDTILTQSGEVLHNHSHDAPLTDGRMVLLDGGGEVASGYGVDVTRTWPVNGTFSGRQRAAYDACLEAQLASIEKCRAGTNYREVHDTSSLVLARFLVDEGLVRGSPEDAVETGAHALFFPHGIGHHLGLDVHDLENFGDRSSYPRGMSRPDQFGTRYLRLNLPLEAGWVVTVEPGLYIVPAILHDGELRGRFTAQVDFEAAAKWIGFGGIRIEDDVHITDGDPDVLTDVVKRPAQVEALVGSGPSAEERLCGQSH